MNKVIVFILFLVFIVIAAPSPSLVSLNRMNESQWRAFVSQILHESDSIFNRYGNQDLFNKIVVSDSLITQKLPEVSEAFQAFAQQRITLDSINRNIPDFIKKSNDSLATVIQKMFNRAYHNWQSSGDYKMWLYTCKAAALADSVMALLRSRYIPSDTLYSNMRDRVRNLTDSIQAIKKQKIFQDDTYFYIISGDYTVTGIERGRYPCDELLYVLFPALDTGALFVPRLNALFKKGKYAEIVTLLRSKDYRGYGPVKYHSIGFLFFQYSIVDSLLFSKYESEILNASNKRQGKSVDLLIQELEKNTNFLFPHAIAKKKRELKKAIQINNDKQNNATSGIYKFFNKIKQFIWKVLKFLGFVTDRKDNEVRNVQQTQHSTNDTAGPSFFWCCYSDVFNKEDDLNKMEGKKLLCLAPTAQNICKEEVWAVDFSSKDYFKLHPDEERGEWNKGNRIACINDLELHASDSNPYVFFKKVTGVSPGLVEKAEVYKLTKNMEIAYIENDSLTIVYDNNYNPTFPDIDVVDRSFAECVLCSHYLPWIGDVNRNNKIDIIIENFASQYGNRIFFLEKQVIKGESVLKSIMTHDKYTYD
jgi:hypothetical protein